MAIILTAEPYRADAKLPELDAVYWGGLSHRSDQPLIPKFTGEIVVSATLNGVKIAETNVAENNNVFVLKIPMDDGREPRVPGTARAGERIRVFIRNTMLDQEFETVQTLTAALSISAIKGDIQAQNLSVAENLASSSQLQAAFVAWAEGFRSSTGVDSPSSDNDADGFTNYEEFLADTDPLSADSHLSILSIIHRTPLTSVRFGPVRLSRLYTLYGSGTLEDWQPITSLRPDADSDGAWMNHVQNASGFTYFKVGVDIE